MFYVIGYDTGVGSWDNYSGTFTVLAPTLVELAELAINNYFTVLLSGSDPTFALSAMNTAIKAVANPLQVKEVQAYYAQQNVIYLYQYALKLIGLYSTSPNSTTLSAAVTAVIQLQPYNSTKALSGLGLYDDALNQLMQAVSKNLSSLNNVPPITPPVNVDGSFGTLLRVDSSGDIFISAPSNAAKGYGAIYEFSKNSQNVYALINTITPISTVAGDHFGREFRIDGDNLIASSEPANGKARVYIFKLQSNNTWLQENYLDLTSELGISSIKKIYLGYSYHAIVVGLPEYGKSVIFNHVFYYSTGNPQTYISDNWSPFTVTLPKGSTLSSVESHGLTVAIGAQVPNSHGALIGSVFIYEGTINVTTANSENEYSISWNIDIEETGAKGFGQSLRVHSSPAISLPIGDSTITSFTQPTISQIALAIGSPLESNGAGAVYTHVKSIDPTTRQLTWGTRSQIPLLMPTTARSAGYEIAYNGTSLLVSATNKSAETPALVMAYTLNSTTNQWSWNYTLSNSNPLYGASVGLNGPVQAIGSPKAADDKNSADIDQVIVIDPNLLPPTSLVIQSDSGDYIGQGQNYNYTSSNATFNVIAGRIQSDGKVASVHFSITSTTDSSQWWYVDIETATMGQDLVPGVYTNAQRAAFAAQGHPGLEVYGEGRGSNTLTGQFTIINAKFDYTDPSNPKVISFAASFVQHSEGATPALNGTIYYNYSP